MNGMVKDLKVLNDIRLRKELKKEITASKIFELKVPLNAVFEVILYRSSKYHFLSEIG